MRRVGRSVMGMKRGMLLKVETRRMELIGMELMVVVATTGEEGGEERRQQTLLRGGHLREVREGRREGVETGGDRMGWGGEKMLKTTRQVLRWMEIDTIVTKARNRETRESGRHIRAFTGRRALRPSRSSRRRGSRGNRGRHRKVGRLMRRPKHRHRHRRKCRRRHRRRCTRRSSRSTLPSFHR